MASAGKPGSLFAEGVAESPAAEWTPVQQGEFLSIAERVGYDTGRWQFYPQHWQKSIVINHIRLGVTQVSPF